MKILDNKQGYIPTLRCFGQSVLYAVGGYAASWGLYSRFIKIGVYTYSRHKAL